MYILIRGSSKRYGVMSTVWCEFITMVGNYVSRTRLCDVKKPKIVLTFFVLF